MIVRPKVAAVGSDGRVVINVEKASPNSERVYGLASDNRTRERPQFSRTDTPRQMPRLDERPFRKPSKDPESLHAALEQTMRSNDNHV